MVTIRFLESRSVQGMSTWIVEIVELGGSANVIVSLVITTGYSAMADSRQQ